MRKNILTCIFIAFLLLSLAGCSNQEISINAKDIKVAVASPQAVAGEINFSGILDAEDSANLTAQLAGTVLSVEAKEGHNIDQGDTIITFDKRELAIQLEQARINLQKSQEGMAQAQISLKDSELELARYQELFQAGAISQKELEQITTKKDLAQSQFEVQKAGVASAANSVKLSELNMTKIDIKSPFTGTISTCTVSPGDTVSIGTSLASVVAIDHLILTGNISQNLINYIKVGQQVEMQSDVIPERSFQGEVVFVSPISISTGQLFPVKIQIANSHRLLKAGMSGIARINIEENASLAIPKTAVFQQHGQNYVYVISDGKALKKPVQIGIIGEQYSSVLNGLKAGDKVVAEGLSLILDGDSVNENH